MRRIAIVVGLLAGLLCAAASVVPLDAIAVRPVVKPVVSPTGLLSGLSAADAAVMRQFYAAMADIVERDGRAKEPVCKTVFELRARYKHALSMAFENTGIVGKYDGLGERLDAYLLDAIGDKDVALTPELRQSAAKAFAAVK